MQRWFIVFIGILLVGCVAGSGAPSANPPFTVTVPPAMNVEKGQTLTYPDRTLEGTSYRFPASVGSGTVLREARIDVATGAPSGCIQRGGKPATLGGEAASEWSWDDAGAGNLYAGISRGVVHGGTCFRVSLFLHLCNLGPDCEPGRTAPFDRAGVEAVFKQVADSLVFQS